jgi:hypothetical protein
MITAIDFQKEINAQARPPRAVVELGGSFKLVCDEREAVAVFR